MAKVGGPTHFLTAEYLSRSWTWPQCVWLEDPPTFRCKVFVLTMNTAIVEGFTWPDREHRCNWKIDPLFATLYLVLLWIRLWSENSLTLQYRVFISMWTWSWSGIYCCSHWIYTMFRAEYLTWLWTWPWLSNLLTPWCSIHIAIVGESTYSSMESILSNHEYVCGLIESFE